MHTRGPQDTRGLDVAIVGGGASGTLAAIQLLRQAAESRQPLQIWLIDEHARHGLGQAYSTGHDAHLLNAMAGRMSALPGEPGHLVSWAQSSPAVPGPVSDATFLPRRAYGQYLRDTLAAAEHAARPGGQLTRISAAVTAIRPGRDGHAAQLELAGEDRGRPPLDADVVILATGNMPAALPFEAPDCSAVIRDPWRPGALDQVTASRDGSRVVIVGSGLTMVDLALAITSRRPGSVVHAVSRHGLLPRAHPADPPALASPPWLPATAQRTGPVRLADLMRQVRQAAGGRPERWPAVLDSLRPHIPDLWQRMPEQDKRAFLRHVARHWEVNRHLMPPATTARITTLRLTGQLVIHRGQVLAARPHQGGVGVVTATACGAGELQGDWLIGAAGGTADITTAASPLLRGLFASGLARPDPLRLGVDAGQDGAVLGRDGQPAGFLYALGPPLRGVRYETTAIPEIREQAAALAGQIIASNLGRLRGSAA